MKKLLLVLIVAMGFAQKAHADVLEMIDDLNRLYLAVEEMRKEDQEIKDILAADVASCLVEVGNIQKAYDQKFSSDLAVFHQYEEDRLNELDKEKRSIGSSKEAQVSFKGYRAEEKKKLRKHQDDMLTGLLFLKMEKEGQGLFVKSLRHKKAKDMSLFDMADLIHRHTMNRE